MTLSDRIKEAITASGKKSAQIATEAGVSPGAVSQWMSGQTMSLKGKSAVGLSRATGYSAEWLMNGVGQKLVSAEQSVIPANPGGHQVPVLSTEQVASMTDAADQNPTSGASSWIATHKNVSVRAFALEIVGNSMRPRFAPGDLIIVDPARTPRPGDFVLARTTDGEVTFRKYRPRAATAFELVPLNDDYPTIEADADTATILGKMVEHRTFVPDD